MGINIDIGKLTNYMNPEIENKQKSDTKNRLSSYMVEISRKQFDYCVGTVDIVGSTKISAAMGQKKASKYYQFFLNSMSQIINRFGGIVIKNIGDCLLYYFPDSAEQHRMFGFICCLECSLTMVEAHDELCAVLNKQRLPNVDYRVSIDYGPVTLMQSNNSTALDLLGPAVNMCNKINRIALPTTVVVGGDLYQMVKDLNDYKFKLTKGYSIGFKYDYPVYNLTRNGKQE